MIDAASHVRKTSLQSLSSSKAYLYKTYAVNVWQIYS
nr:MAG TPA: hypothetical protein [Caudoviricetes sp.]